jgi:hypothetical protein
MAMTDLGEALHVAESPGPRDSRGKHFYHKRDAPWLVAAVMWVSRSLGTDWCPRARQVTKRCMQVVKDLETTK